LGSGKAFRQEDPACSNSSEVLEEFSAWYAQHQPESEKLDYVTISGLGEPTLHSSLKEVIAGIKKVSNCRVAVITNSSLIPRKEIRECLLGADLIVPSLDAVTAEAFQKIDRPSSGVKIEEIIEGLVALRKEFKGQLWLEVMLVRGINDDRAHIAALTQAIKRINPDKIQLNSPVRTTSEKDIFPIDKKQLEEIKALLGEKCEIA